MEKTITREKYNKEEKINKEKLSPYISTKSDQPRGLVVRVSGN
jgi:hypothetical protein